MPSETATTWSWFGVLRDSVLLRDSPWRWAAGVQAGLANALPMALFSVIGHLQLGLISSLGAFTALFATAMPLRERLRVLPFVGAAFVTASGLGVICAGNTGLAITCMIVVALAATVLVFAGGLGPPGLMPFVLVAGVSGRLASTAHVSTASFTPRSIPVLVALGALSAYIVVAVPAALSFIRRKKIDEPLTSELFSLGRLDAEKATITVRVVLAVATASLLSALFRTPHGYWMAVVAAAVLQSTPVSQHTAIRALQRVIGTLLGIATFGVIRLAAPAGAWLIVTIAVLQFAIEVVVGRNYALALAFITPTALTIAATGASTSGALVSERIVDTVLGAMIAMVVLRTTEWMCKRDRRLGMNFVRYE